MDNNVDFLRWALVVSCVGSGMMAGLFASFSTFMMKALGSLERSEGVRAMQAINRLIVRPSFLLVFMGTAAFSCGFGLCGLWRCRPMALHWPLCWAVCGRMSTIDDPV